ncbi:MAG: acyl--CoA ligase [Rhodobacteraceae bacterium]|nr:acyl--CoA ligase [Paracoccaceae bacterium]
MSEGGAEHLTLPLTAATVPDEVFTDLPSRVRSLAQHQPEAVALIDAETRMSSAELALMMDRSATALAQAGVTPGDVVASLAGVSVDHVLLYLGAAALGAAMAPLPTSAHPDALTRMIENSGADLLLADASAPDLPDQAGRLRDLGGFIETVRSADPAPARTLGADGLFDIIYSSGTTGLPKGIEHDAIFRDRQIRRLAGFGLGPGTVTLISTPVYSNTTLAALLPALGLGSTMVLMRKFDERRFLELAQKHRVTHAMLVPVQLRRLLDHPEFDSFDLSSFQVKLATSAPLPAPLMQEILDRWPGRMVNIYGMTEGGVSAILDGGAHPDKLHTVGRPPANAQIRILDDEGRELPVGETGEVVGRSATIMLGYRKAPETTREAVWISPEGEAFIRTGDMGRLDEDGFLTLLDRRKDMIISGGFNIFAVDLENVLSGHPAVAEAAVIGVPSRRWGETPVACVALHSGAAAVAGQEILDWTNAQLGKTQRLSDLAILPELPRNAIGKVLKRELKDRWAEIGGERV